ncbi:MAG TPA: hotdog fold domain-containing protein [Candidatus Wallbacteria bacterium]|nr:MAG: Thioesterase superfamily protein [bacterium ADurb.Bin243]HPG56371.1 hotdog fold domain-containing protein [Candidatus Wallbacteria bacterium]
MHNKTCWACGPDNEAGLKIKVDCDPVSHVSEASFYVEERYAGNAGVAHGGVICSIFDSLMTHSAMAYSRKKVFTASLEVKFKKKIPAGETIKITCWYEKKRFGFLVMKGRITDHKNKVMASANAMFSESETV